MHWLSINRAGPAQWAIALGLTLLFTRPWLEAGMVGHMGVQIPLLVILGTLLMSHWLTRLAILERMGRRYRTALLLFSLITLMLWMLPRMLDAALHQPAFELAKWLSLSLAGAALYLSWVNLPLILRGVLHLELNATLLRLGWLYLQAPERYCVSYGIGDQQNLGFLLLIYAAGHGLWLSVRLMFVPRPQTSPARTLR